MNLSVELVEMSDFQTTLFINISTKTTCWKLHGMGFHGQVAPVGVMLLCLIYVSTSQPQTS